MYQQAKINLFSDPNNQTLSVIERASHLEFKKHEAAYASYLYQKSKIDWIRFGDENSAMFYASMKKRKATSRIVSFVAENGRVEVDYRKVISHFTQHFQSFLGGSSVASGLIESSVMHLGPILSLDDQTELLKPFTFQDVKIAMFSIKAVKSPGPDGFGAGFFKSLWSVIGKEVATTVLEFFDTGCIPKALNNTILTLIPKVSQPSNASEYRPIARGVQINRKPRLTSILPKLVNQNQGAFVKNRSLAHNVLILQNLLKGYNRKRVSPQCLMKIDLSKAYDSIDWDFLENLLNAYKFPGKFIKWIMVCLRGSSYCILMNGQLHGNFKGGKGLRQGDPISPLLFVLVMEYLTRALHGAAKDKNFRFHPLCKALNITNLCFADDLLLVCKAHASFIQIMHHIFSSFSAASGLCINHTKSRIYFGGISSIEKENLLSLSNMTEGKFPLVYLGMPLRPTKWKAMDCDLIVSKIRIFLWGGNGSRSKLHLASWDHVCRPKSYGGLGFKEGVLWNKINLARYIWAITSKQDSLWVKWVNCIYLKGVQIWDYVLQQDASWYWKKLIKMSKFLSNLTLNEAVCQGKFQMSKLYLMSIPSSPITGMKAIWCKLSVPKHRFIFWQAINQKLLTRDLMQHCHIPVLSLYCSVCEIELECHSHLFFDCLLSKRVLQAVAAWLGNLIWPRNFKNLRTWLNESRNHGLSQVVSATLAATVYYLWINRNKCWLENCYFSVYHIDLLIKESVKDVRESAAGSATDTEIPKQQPDVSQPPPRRATEVTINEPTGAPRPAAAPASPGKGKKKATEPILESSDKNDMDSENVFDMYCAPEVPEAPASKKIASRQHQGESSKVPPAKKS
ncbi:uncharacterized protein LOC133784657 [Humulus lupulus]|uniref:uncharacterized protein LOC133784657 n=1 Tax=Humulus lupulus TaxID=3486 RepID=UPI002B40B7C8|nr:uncharacterized protein LOC133784657 [Humulus lupulus]